MFYFLKQIIEVIPKKDHKKLFLIFIMILTSSFLDLIGVSIIMPIVSLLSAPNVEVAIEENALLSIIASIFNTSDNRRLSIIALLVIILLYVIKTIYSYLLTYVNVKFTTSFNRQIRARLISIYLSMPYEFHHENNSSTLIRKSTYDVDVFCTTVSNFLSFLVKLTTALFIIVFLFITSYIITLITSAALSLFAIVTIYVLKNKNKKMGKELQKLNNNNYKYLSQAFSGIKESKICNNESYFINQYIGNIRQINGVAIKKAMYSSIPGHTLEFVGILGIVISLLVVIQIGGTKQYQIISTFAVFAYATIKLLPCATEITAFLNNFSFNSSSVNTIYNELKEISNLENNIEHYDEYSKLVFDNAISVNNITFSYKDEPDKIVLNDVSFNIPKNTSVAISGKSGTGKTTLVDVILGLLKPTSGHVYCDKTDINTNVRGWRDNLSYVPQNIFLTDDTIRNNIAFGIDANKVDDERIWDALTKAELREFVEQSPKGLDTIVGEHGIRLSGGQRQRIGIARAFYRNTNIIVLDEATSALDYETEKNILDHITEYTKDHTLIIITHRLNTIEKCDYIYKIENGSITTVKSNKQGA